MVTIRVFYSPQCPAVFPSLDRIDDMSSRYGCSFERVDISDLESRKDANFHPSERSMLERMFEAGPSKYFFATTFVDGVEVPGFPIPVSSIEERVCSELGIEYRPPSGPGSLYARQKVDIITTQISVYPISPGHFDGECELCLNHHPLTSRDHYTPEQVEAGKRGKKREFLEKLWKSNELAGFIAYVDTEPAGMVEALPHAAARSMGFVCSGRQDSWVITCLTVRAEYQDNGIGRMLVTSLIEKMKEGGWSRLEVFGTKGGESIWEKWQSKSFYKKLGFISTDVEVNDGDELLTFMNSNSR